MTLLVQKEVAERIARDKKIDPDRLVGSGVQAERYRFYLGALDWLAGGGIREGNQRVRIPAGTLRPVRASPVRAGLADVNVLLAE